MTRTVSFKEIQMILESAKCKFFGRKWSYTHLAMSDSEEEGIERQVKVALVGGPQVGKTCIALRYINNTFEKNYQVSL